MLTTKMYLSLLVWWMGVNYKLFCATLCTRSDLLVITDYVIELNLLSSLDTGYIRENHLPVTFNGNHFTQL